MFYLYLGFVFGEIKDPITHYTSIPQHFFL